MNLVRLTAAGTDATILGAMTAGANNTYSYAYESNGSGAVAAKAGDSVVLFAVGLGRTNPVVQPGQVFSGSAPTTSSVSLSINNVNLIPTFSGLSSAGLYQVNLTVPSGLGTGDVSLVATAGGARTPSGGRDLATVKRVGTRNHSSNSPANSVNAATSKGKSCGGRIPDDIGIDIEVGMNEPVSHANHIRPRQTGPGVPKLLDTCDAASPIISMFLTRAWKSILLS